MKNKSKGSGTGKKGGPAVKLKVNPITDPQENMEGPVSSLMQKIKDDAEKNDDKEKAKHEQKKNHTGGDFINE